MPIPSVITDLSATAASNSPAGSDAPSTLDDIQRAHGAFIRQLYDLVASASGALSSSAYSTGNLAYTGTLTGGTGAVNLGAGQFYKSSAGLVGLGTTTPASPLDIVANDTTASLRDARDGAVAPTAQLKVSFYRHFGTNEVGRVAVVGTSVTGNPLNEAAMVLSTGNGAGLVERMRLKPAGQVRLYPLSAAPSNAEEGDVYYDSTTKKHYGYNGSGWQAMY